MARLTPLSTLFSMLQSRIGETTTQTNTKARYYQLLSDKQQWFAGAYDWPFMETRFDIVPIAAHARYLAFPSTDSNGETIAMNMERPYLVERLWTRIWDKVEYGIGSEQYNAYNSDVAGVYQDPIQRWRWNNDNTGAGVGQIEVWPVPAGATQQLRFTGQRVLRPLVVDGDKAELDDQLLVLAVAADLLTKSKSADAQFMFALASERLRSIRANYPCEPLGFNFGGDVSRDPSLRPAVKLVAIAGSN